jgi:aspartyl-tRNA(Asn)/glutamyl-tRNA(Gln) amidotransferase subunit A
MAVEPQTISELSRALESREITATAVTERCLERIAERNAALNAFIAVLADDALAQASEADREIAAGRYRGPLHGVPLSLKDLFDVRGTSTTAASRVRRAHVAAADAESIARLRAAGAVFVGKTNLHEFAFGTTNEESAFGPARHPLDSTRSPGGSSGGSAVSVAAGMAYASLGTDTGGSIRIPSAACGLVGLKPSLGEISTAGVVPLSTTMDHVGPLCRSAADAEILYNVLRGAATHDAPGASGLSRKPQSPEMPRGLRLGVPREYFTTLLDAQVATAFASACERVRGAGVEVEDVQISHAGDIAAVYLHIVLSEAATYHAKTLESRPDDYTPGVRTRLEMGRYILAEDYLRAVRGREILRLEVEAALSTRDALLLPALAIPAPKLGADRVHIGGAEEPVRNVMLRLTQLFNVTGHPAIAIPCGKTVEGLPIGAQLIGHMNRTPDLLRHARAIEPYLGPGTSG